MTDRVHRLKYRHLLLLNCKGINYGVGVRGVCFGVLEERNKDETEDKDRRAEKGEIKRRKKG